MLFLFCWSCFVAVFVGLVVACRCQWAIVRCHSCDAQSVSMFCVAILNMAVVAWHVGVGEAAHLGASFMGRLRQFRVWRVVLPSVSVLWYFWMGWVVSRWHRSKRSLWFFYFLSCGLVGGCVSVVGVFVWFCFFDCLCFFFCILCRSVCRLGLWCFFCLTSCFLCVWLLSVLRVSLSCLVCCVLRIACAFRWFLFFFFVAFLGFSRLVGCFSFSLCFVVFWVVLLLVHQTLSPFARFGCLFVLLCILWFLSWLSSSFCLFLRRFVWLWVCVFFFACSCFVCFLVFFWPSF
ncbi:hypothetical protein L349_04921 [Enterobacter sp. MGH 3]|nr:hypothetical protein L349_04921 [Enterobacter sp. MGH 3]